MEPIPRNIVYLELDDGKSPFREWFENLKDKKAQITVDARLARVRDGNFGDHKSVGDGVFELRISLGKGLRIYYGLDGDTLVIVLCAGDKGSQRRDIGKAKELWSKYLDEKDRL